jgi:hypothetical protein
MNKSPSRREISLISRHGLVEFLPVLNSIARKLESHRYEIAVFGRVSHDCESPLWTERWNSAWKLFPNSRRSRGIRETPNGWWGSKSQSSRSVCRKALFGKICYYPLLRVLPLLRHLAPGPRPRHSMIPCCCRFQSVRRIMSLLTPGHALSIWLREKDPRNLPMAALIICVLAPRGLLIWPRRLSNSLYADFKMKRR